MVDWLKKYGYTNINIIDNKSDYPPLLEYYKNCGCNVIYMRKNYGHLVIYKSLRFLFMRMFNFYIMTDPDLAPVENMPDDFVEQFLKTMLEYPNSCKVGCSLKIDDIPDSFKLKNEVILLHTKFYTKQLKHFTDGYKIYDQPIDTTFALDTPAIYRGLHERFKGIRTGEPYQLRHLPWYELDENHELEHYRKTEIAGVGNWNGELTGADILEKYYKNN